MCSCFEEFAHVFRDPRFEFAGFVVEDFEFLVESFELFLEILIAEILALGDADVAAGIERPALGFDFLKGGGFAEAGDVPIVDS